MILPLPPIFKALPARGVPHFAGAGRVRRHGEWGPCRRIRGPHGRGEGAGPGRAAAPGDARYGWRVIREPLSVPGRTVIFDYGEVISLSQSPADRTALERLAGVSDVD